MKPKININDVDLIAYDFDGVMTDNKVIISENGKESVVVNRSDGLAISKIKEMKIEGKTTIYRGQHQGGRISPHEEEQQV